MIPGLQFNIQFNLSDPDLFMDAEKTDTISKSRIGGYQNAHVLLSPLTQRCCV